MYRIVLDTNVLVNGMQDENSATFKLIEAAIARKLTAIISYKIKRENERLTNQLLNDGDYLQMLEDFYNVCEEVEPKRRIHVVETDKDDNKFVEAAVASGADFIVTSDSDLLDLEEFEGIRMITPEQLWGMYKDESEEDNPWNVWVEQL